jgi:hypothetical protein
MDDRPDPRQQLRETMRQLDEKSAPEQDALDAHRLRLAQQCIDLWHHLWAEDAVTFDPALEIKSRICFPLAAHALNHVDASLSLRLEHPWVTASCARVAFEHALAAQWVLLTEGGDQELVNWMNLWHHKRGRALAEALTPLISDPAMSVLALTESQLQTLISDPPDPSRWSVSNACDRFSGTKLFYDIYRNLSQAEHPSHALIATHLDIVPSGRQYKISAAGTLRPSGDVPLALALSALWSLQVLEQIREGQPHAETVAQIGRESSLPADLRASDQHPERQPGTVSHQDG